MHYAILRVKFPFKRVETKTGIIWLSNYLDKGSKNINAYAMSRIEMPEFAILQYMQQFNENPHLQITQRNRVLVLKYFFSVPN